MSGTMIGHTGMIKLWQSKAQIVLNIICYDSPEVIGYKAKYN